MRSIAERQAFYERYHSQHCPHEVTQLMHAVKLDVITDLIQSVGGEKLSGRALVVGCGRGDDTRVLDSPVVAVDLSLVALRTAQAAYPENHYVVAAGCSLPFPADTFKTIICSEVIEHVLEPDSMLAEFHRLLAEGGELILTTPNWHGFFGLARKLGELITGRPMTSGDQPIDHWYTLKELQTLLAAHFKMREWRGIWYFPPVGKGHRTIPLGVVLPLYQALLPLDRALGRWMPKWGHMHGVRAEKTRGKR